MSTDTQNPRIGVFNMPMVIPGPVNREPTPAKLEFANGSEIEFTPPPGSPVVATATEEPAPLSWPAYIAWRKTKCRPFDYENGPALATRIPSGALLSRTEMGDRFRALEEIDQATHELVGEVAELGELFIENGLNAFYEHRDKVIDECGDILFCAMWAFDAWGMNPLGEATEENALELVQPDPKDTRLTLGQFIAALPINTAMANDQFAVQFMRTVLADMLSMQTYAGLLCNSFKELRFQRREQNVALQCERIADVITIAACILVIANSSVEEALKVNMKKLNARFPDGYTGPGGGIRTGDGK